jgi:hypothetical protein
LIHVPPDVGAIGWVFPHKGHREGRFSAWLRRNEIELLFRRIFSRFEKFDVMFMAFINFALIADGLRISVNQP